ncbi:MAG: multicopper oxidase domain-containing protein [Pedococcus sp.]
MSIDSPVTPSRVTYRFGRSLVGALTVSLALLGTAGPTFAAQAHNPAPRPAGKAVQKTTVSSLAPSRRSKPVAPTLDAAAKAAIAGSTIPQLAPNAGLRAAAAGTLAPSGCVTVGTDVSCDLWSMPGTATILGRAVPIWGFSTSESGAATLPGPQLVVHTGDTVTVTLHNGISTAMSLTFPGIPGTSFTAGLSATAEQTGIAPGAMASYTFTATRPGTFLYEAGHTPNGSRQVAMGLAGALVVTPGDGSAYGSSATAFADEAVVVLGEVDPAFNDNPLTFDLRNFRPDYRLVNGKAFPETDAIPTDVGHRVLLRYVNAGSVAHPMGLLGADQLVVGTEGHPSAYPQQVGVVAVSPGETVDAITTMPSGAESKVTLYETANLLTNASMTTSDPSQTAPGGMMAFVDTQAPAPVDDAVGPVTTKLTVSPNPSNGLSPVTVTADLTDVPPEGSSYAGTTVSQAEFVIDDAESTGVGFGIPMSGTFGTATVTGATGTIDTTVLASLAAGRHQIFVRGKDAAGNWGALGSVVLNLPKTGPSTTNGSAKPNPASAAIVKVTATGDDTTAGGTITKAEYFIDTAGATDTGAAMTGNFPRMVAALTASIPAATIQGLTEGTHHVLVRSLDSLGLWGPTLDIPLVVDHTGPTVDGAAVGPNPTNGVLTDRANPGYLVVSATITDRDAALGLQSTIADAEAYIDPTSTNPTVRGLQMIAADGSLDSVTETVYGLIPISQVKSLTNGNHVVSVRGKDVAGNWGALFPATLVVDRTAPQLTGISASPNPTNSAANLELTAPTNETAFRAAEFWRGTDPGVGNATSVPVSFVGGSVVVSVPLAGVPLGSQTFGLRAQDTAGNWSNAQTVTVSVTRVLAIFSDNFDSGNLAAWSGSTGSVAVTAPAGIPSGGANRGLAVTLAGKTNNRPSYVVDATPAGETLYDAQFAIVNNTLTTGTGGGSVVNLFETRTAAGGQVYALQYRGSGATAQVRVVLSRSGGLAPANGAWVTLGSGAHTLKTAWRSGPATGTVRGRVVLTRDGTVVTTLNGATTGLAVDDVWLGVTGGVNMANNSPMAGTAYFDSFVSTRVGP